MEDRRSKQKKVLSEIQSLSESIRRKHRGIKRGMLDTASILEKSFQPLVDPLKTLTKQFSEKLYNTDKKKRAVSDHEASVTNTNELQHLPQSSTPVKNLFTTDHEASVTNTNELQHLPQSSTPVKNLFTNELDESMLTPRLQSAYSIAETPDSPAAVYLSTHEGRRTGTEMLEQLPYAILAKEYMKRFLTDTSNTIDHTYGPRMVDDIIMIGDGALYFDNNDLYIKGTRYTGTQGLYELIFMKRPDVNLVSNNDRKAYKAMLISTSAHRQRYDPDKQVNSNVSYKYRTIIRTLFPRGGKLVTDTDIIMNKSAGTNAEVEYIYWNDINELVERLKLLIASQDAGHTGHNNEILNIIEELQEAGVIV